MSHPHAELITRFYTAFAARDAQTMAACYHAEAHFSDPAFPDLRGAQIGQMWAMLCSRAQDFSLSFRDVVADDKAGSAHWDARYIFSKTGRSVLNQIDATFTFRDGLIATHVDQFNFWRWSAQALGVPGQLLGWTSWLRGKVQAEAARGLASYTAKTP